MVLPFTLLRAVHVEWPTCVRWSGDWSELGHSFLSSEPRERGEVMILCYDTEGHVKRIVVKWQPLISNGGRAEPLRMKSCRFGGR